MCPDRHARRIAQAGAAGYILCFDQQKRTGLKAEPKAKPTESVTADLHMLDAENQPPPQRPGDGESARPTSDAALNDVQRNFSVLETRAARHGYWLIGSERKCL